MILDPLYWIVLAASLVVFWILPQKFRAGFLAVASLVVLGVLVPRGAAWAAMWAILFFVLSPAQSAAPRQALLLPILVLGVVSHLVFYKVAAWRAGEAWSPASESWLIPAGMSYYAFKLVHYAVEVRRGEIPRHTLQDFLAYVFFFPGFTAGPIERFDHFLKERELSLKAESIAFGLTRIAHGLVKKFVFLRFVSELVPHTNENIAQGVSTRPAFLTWALLFVTLVKVYLDFSAYSDIAIGAGRLFGLKYAENFDWPLLSVSPIEFWRRWHMSLTDWCRSYVFFPLLGATRSPRLALYGSFLVMGVWHVGSVNRLAWGAYHATGIVLYRLLAGREAQSVSRLRRVLQAVVGVPATIAFVTGSMAFVVTDNASSPMPALRILAKLLGIDV